MPHKTYNTPKRKCVVKTRLTEDERRAFEDKCAALSMSQSEYIRQAVFYSRISPVIRVTAHSEEMLTAISSLVAQYGKIGSNLNQIARYLNEYGAPYNALSSEVRAAVSDLAALKFEVLKVIGEAYAFRYRTSTTVSVQTQFAVQYFRKYRFRTRRLALQTRQSFPA